MWNTVKWNRKMSYGWRVLCLWPFIWKFMSDHKWITEHGIHCWKSKRSKWNKRHSFIRSILLLFWLSDLCNSISTEIKHYYAVAFKFTLDFVCIWAHTENIRKKNPFQNKKKFFFSSKIRKWSVEQSRFISRTVCNGTDMIEIHTHQTMRIKQIKTNKTKWNGTKRKPKRDGKWRRKKRRKECEWIP